MEQCYFTHATSGDEKNSTKSKRDSKVFEYSYSIWINISSYMNTIKYVLHL